jgi:transcriptional regulator with XRE-family HTH domain
MTKRISAQQVSGAHIREARKLLGWTQQKLAEMTNLSLLTVKRLEAGNAGKDSVEKTTHLLRSAGMEFVREDGQAGVKLMRQPASNRTTATEANREGVYKRRKRRPRKLDPMDLGGRMRQRVQYEVRSFVDKFLLCYKT